MGDTFRLVIECECLAAWMPICNAFRHRKVADWDTEKHYWCGILIQLGAYSLISSQEQTHNPASPGPVVFKPKCNDVAEIPIDKFRKHNLWINVVAGKWGREGLEDPVKKEDIDLLFPPEPGNAEQPKSLHKYLTVPKRKCGITVWQDWHSGYDVRARMNGNLGSHDDFEFSFTKGEGFNVAIWNYPGGDVESADPDEIRITDAGAPGHGDSDGPPQRP